MRRRPRPCSSGIRRPRSWSRPSAVTVSEAVLVFPPSLPVTVCGPAAVAVQLAPVHVPSGEIENVVNGVTSPSELFAASKASAVYVCEAAASTVALAGLITMWSRTAPLTCSVAVPVLPAFVPVTVCAPETGAVHVAPVQEPFGEIENVVPEVRSPSELSYWSRPSAVYACDVPAVIVAEAGDSTRWSSAAAVTVSEAVPVLPPLVPVTVCCPATEAVHVAPVQDPSGAIENVVLAVRSPSELPYASRPSAVNTWEPPAAIDREAGVSARWSSPSAVTVSDAVLVFPLSFPVTVCTPAAVAVHVAPVQVPSGEIENVVKAVTSPVGLPAASNPCAV